MNNDLGVWAQLVGVSSAPTFWLLTKVSSTREGRHWHEVQQKFWLVSLRLSVEFEFETNWRVSAELVENTLHKEVARPERFELPPFWFVANGVKTLSALSGVAYELGTPFFSRLAAPNHAPKLPAGFNRQFRDCPSPAEQIVVDRA